MGKDDEDNCSCTTSMATIWLVVFNLILSLIGIGIMVLGFLLRFNSQFFETYVLDILTSAEVDGIDLKSVFESVAIVVILVGLIVAGVSIAGLLGGCCKIKMLLTIYSLVMIKLLIIEIVIIILFIVLRSEIDSRVKGALQGTLDTYEGYNSTAPVTIGWNYVFSKFDCCGIDDYQDVYSASNWDRNITYAGDAIHLLAPLFCCKDVGVYPSITLPSDGDCGSAPNSTISNYNDGCYKAVEDYIFGYRLVLIICGSIVMACQLLNIFTACTVRSDIIAEKKAKKKRRGGRA